MTNQKNKGRRHPGSNKKEESATVSDPLEAIEEAVRHLADKNLRRAVRIIDHATERMREQRIHQASTEAARVVELYGVELKHVIGPTPHKRNLETDKRRYVNPYNPRKRWSGRGQRPRWAAAYIEQGGDLADLDILGTGKPKQPPRRRRTRQRKSTND